MMLVFGVVLLLLVIWDAFITVFSTSGGGALSSFVTHRLWQWLLAIHRRKAIHGLLAMAGPAMLLGSIVFWYIAQGVGWMLIFGSSPGSVVNNTTGEPADLSETIYFVGTTISSLGYGDYVPAAGPWTLASSSACFFSTVVLTVSLSYVLSVLNAAVEQRVLAQQIFSLGKTPRELVRNARLGDARDSLKHQVLGVTTDLDSYSHKHLIYPVLHYFHSPTEQRSPARAVLLLADAFFLLRHTEDESLRPPRGLLRVVESSIDAYLELTDTRVAPRLSVSPRPNHFLDGASEVGVDEHHDTVVGALSEYGPRRERLLVHCRQDGW